uniref:N-acetyltransferase domain-containing protein n=1 Tax=Plectus sambesii TaxID=2011161 RepID=A0A914WM82_9BILA
MAQLGNVEYTQSPTKEHWAQMRHLVETANWTSDDHSVMDMLPYFPATRSVFAVEGDKVLGFAVWSESPETRITWVGFYYIIEELRGKGLGRQVWKKMMDCKPAGKTWALRAFEDMVAKYRSEDFPIAGEEMRKVAITAGALKEGADKAASINSTTTVRCVSQLSEDELKQLCAYDKEVTKQDRSAMLREFFKQKGVIGAVAQRDGAVVGYGATVPTALVERKQIKLAPLFADKFETAVAIVKQLLVDADPESPLIIYVLERSIGNKEFINFLLQQKNARHEITCHTILTDANDSFPIDLNACFVPHNHACHIDG